ncbi:MAG: rifampicin phosphotransferase, partial [Actinomycetota bacterium]|nr:rifampicin phosphotransferase [Actinomycetota bacterium]
MSTLTFEPPGPGTWQQDRSHMPEPMTRLGFDLARGPFGEGFTQSFVDYGVPIQSVTMAQIHGYMYLRMQFAGEPGPDGPPDPAETGAFIGRCAAAAEQAFAQKLWRDVIRRWDAELKPAAIATSVRLSAVDLAALDDAALAAHLEETLVHNGAMVALHHRYNTSAMIPVGDFLLHAAGWTARPPTAMLALFEGSSPVSGVWSNDIEPAAKAIMLDPDAAAILASDEDDAARLATLRARVPEVDAWVLLVGCRIADGFDVTKPTLVEVPGLLLGKLAAAVALGGPPARPGLADVEADVRGAVPADHLDEYDELLADARLVYRLRDERGVYTNMASTGLARLALLELGRRLVARGVVEDPEHVFETTADEVRALAGGAREPVAAELRERTDARIAAALVDAPPLLGPPPSPPPPPEAMPPALGRVVSAIGFAIDSILNGLAEPSVD